MADEIQQGSAGIKAWLPVIGLTCSAFVFNTSEFVPIGLLTSISTDLQVSEAQAGLLITAYAWVVAIASLPLMLLCAKMEYRKLLFGVIGLFIVSHAASAVATNYWMLMASRFGVACAHAIFWSIVSPMAVRVAPAGHRATALSLVITGTSIALIVGLPLGRMLGLWWGWRMTFGTIGILAAAVLALLVLIFPRVPNSMPVSTQALPKLLHTPALVGLYFMTVVLVTGQYTGYSYIEPFLASVADFSGNHVTWALTIFGLVGFVGSYVFSQFYEKNKPLLQGIAVLGITAMLVLMLPAAASGPTMIAALLLWGFAMAMLNMCFQTVVIQLAPQGTAIAMSIYSGIFNVGIGAGAMVGGFCTDAGHLNLIGFAGAAFGLVASLFYIFWLLPRLKLAQAA